jgi:dodecin
MPATEMRDHVYKILELVGSSEKSIEDAVQNAITRASKTIREMKWFEVVQTRGQIENGSVRHYQVTLRVGVTLEGKHGLEAIAQAAQNAQACENTGDSEEAREWRHIEDAMKMMRGPHQS